MSEILTVLFFSLVGGLFSLIGGFLLIAYTKRTKNLLTYLTPFAAGALLAAAFVDLLPEASETGSAEVALRWALIGILLFFLLERFVRWFHHHHGDDTGHRDASVPLIIIGDVVHNFIDGVAIAAAFLIDVPTGIVTTLAVAAHEIPQEVGDFGLLLDKGMSKSNVVKANILSALATTVAAVGFYQFGTAISIQLDIILGLVAGFLIYIAVSDILPSIHKHEGQKLAGLQTAMLLTGVILVSLAASILHGYIDAEDDHGHTHSSEHADQH